MKALPCVALVLGLAWQAHAQETLKFGVTVTGGLTGGESRSYTFAADAGDEKQLGFTRQTTHSLAAERARTIRGPRNTDWTRRRIDT